MDCFASLAMTKACYSRKRVADVRPFGDDIAIRNDPKGRSCMRILKIWLCAAATVFGLPGAQVDAQAQNFPNRSITLVIPFAPGGSTSIVGRVIADKMSELLGEQVVVDNRPGDCGTVGTKAVPYSDPDCYTRLHGYSGTLSHSPSL